MADETTGTENVTAPVRKGWPKGKPRTKVEASAEPKAKAPKVDIRVIERRLQDPYNYEEAPVQLRTAEPMYVRWFNDDPSLNGRVYKALHYLGFVFVPREMLADQEQLTGLVDLGDGKVRRGVRGQEVLMMQPMSIRKRIEARKAEIRQKRNRPRERKEELAQAIATKFGTEEAAAVVMGQHPSINLTGTVEETRVREYE